MVRLKEVAEEQRPRRPRANGEEKLVLLLETTLRTEPMTIDVDEKRGWH